MVAKFFVSSSCRAARLSAAGFVSFVAVALMTSLPVQADVTWTLPAGQAGDWSVGSNWWGGVVPTGSDNAYVLNGGTVNVTQPGEVCSTLSVGSSAGSGDVQMTSGGLSIANSSYPYGEYVGDSGTGTFTQTGGANSVAGSLFLGNNAGSSGTYNLSGTGQLSTAGAELVGYSGTGIFTQSGGTNGAGPLPTAQSLFLGYNYGASGTYNLSAGQLLADREYVGYSGTGVFVQSGGNNTTNSIRVGGGGNGTFTQSGGTNTVLEELDLLSGTYNLNGGELVLQSIYTDGQSPVAFNFSGGTLRASFQVFSDLMPITLGTSGGGANFDTAGYSVTLASSLSGPGSLTKVDTGTLTLATSNTFTGNTLVNGGTLALGNSLALQFSTLDTSGSGFLSFGSLTSATFGGLSGPGTLVLSNSAFLADAVALSVGNNNHSTTFSGMLKGDGSLDEIGSGILTLSGSNTYSGPTTVTRGKLVVDGWLTSSAISVYYAGTLGGTGYLSSVTVYPGGNLAPGDSLGTLTVSGSLILEQGAGLSYGLDTPSTSSMINAGNLALNNQQFTDFDFTWTANFAPGNYDLIAFDSYSGNLGSVTSGTIDGYPASLGISGKDLVLTVVPEPSTFVLLGAGVLGLIGWAWRRRRQLPT